MNFENTEIEYKSLSKVTSGDAGFKDLAITCVSLANTRGGTIIIGIEDKDKLPSIGQVVSESIKNKAITRLKSLCFNVAIVLNDTEIHENGAEFFSITILPSQKSIASTSDGKFYVRIGDQCQPARSEDIIRLSSEKDAFQWELQSRGITISHIPDGSITWFANEIRSSDRVKSFVKEKSNLEIAEHYNLIHEENLTNIGVLWLGNAAQRSRLVYPLTVQYIVYDEYEKKIRKEDWSDNTLNPKQLLEEIEKSALELSYFDELPQGLFRKQIRHYDERVIRELLINAIAHKSYTISGDLFIKVYPDRLEITNPGGLPLGISKNNILHSISRRNPFMIKILHDLKLMEGEGSGYDLIYEISGRDSKPFPDISSDFNHTTVIQYSKILDRETVLLIDFIAKNYLLTQKEFIVLGIISRHKKLLSTQLTKELQLSDDERLRTYVSKLIDKGLLVTRGAKKGTEYIINPKLITNSKINIKPTLKTIEPHRLKALIEEDIARYPNSKIANICGRLPDVTPSDIKKIVYKMVLDNELSTNGGNKNRTYILAKKT